MDKNSKTYKEIKVRWNIQGKRTLTDATKSSYKVENINRIDGKTINVYSTKIFSIYVIKTGKKACDVDVKVEEAN